MYICNRNEQEFFKIMLLGCRNWPNRQFFTLKITGSYPRTQYYRDGVYKMYQLLNILAHCQHMVEEVTAPNKVIANL